MKIDLHIERLVLDGLPVDSAQGPAIRAAIQTELTQLLSTHGLSGELRSGVAVPQVRGGTLDLKASQKSANLGRGIAQAVFTGVGPANELKKGGKR
jgi:hypothetical protein